MKYLAQIINLIEVNKRYSLNLIQIRPAPPKCSGTLSLIIRMSRSYPNRGLAFRTAADYKARSEAGKTVGKRT